MGTVPMLCPYRTMLSGLMPYLAGRGGGGGGETAGSATASSSYSKQHIPLLRPALPGQPPILPAWLWARGLDSETIPPHSPALSLNSEQAYSVRRKGLGRCADGWRSCSPTQH